MKELEVKIREALNLLDYLEINSEEERRELSILACELSNRIKKRFGEIPIWYASNRIIRALDDAKIITPHKDTQ